MSKRVEAQDGNISINPITGVVEVYNVNSLVMQTTTAGLGGLLVDQGSGLSAVITDSTLPIADGTVDGDMLYWDQTGTQEYLSTSNLSWDVSNQALSIGGNLIIEDEGGVAGSTGVTQFKNGVGTVMLQFLDTDGPWVQIEDFNLKLADDGASVSRRAAFWGGNRNEIKTLADGEFNFSAETPNATPRAHFDYPLSILNTGAPPATRSNSAQLWVNGTGGAFNPALFVKSGATSWPVGQATSLHYYYNNPTAAADPGTQRLRFNTADFATAGEIYFDDLDFSEEDSGWWFGRAAVGDVMMMSSGADRTEWCEAQIDSITDNTGWWTIEVTILDHAGTMFTNGQDCRVDLVRSSILTTGPADGTADGQMLVWDQTTDLAWEATTQFTFRENATGGGNIYFTGAGTDFLQWTAGDGGVVYILEPVLRLANSVRLDIWPTGLASRPFIQGRSGSTWLDFTAESPTAMINTGAKFFYPLTIASQATKPTSPSADSNMFWVSQFNTNTTPVAFTMNEDSVSFPLGAPTDVVYMFNSGVTATDPTSRQFKLNNASFASVTEAYINDESLSRDDSGWWMDMLNVGDLITFTSGPTRTRWLRATVDSITDNTGWWTLGLTHVDSAGTVFVNTDDVRMSITPFPAGNITGTIADNQIVTGTGASTVDSSANLTYDGTTLTMAGASAQLIVPQNATPLAPTIAFGDGDTGFYELSDDTVRVSIGGTELYQFDATHFTGTTSASFYLRNTTVTSTNPSIGPRRDTNTGIGSAANDSMSLIAGGTEHMRFDATVGGQDHIKVEVPLYLDQRTVALNDYANYGQIWVQTDTPNRLMFTDDTGQDIRISPYRATVQTTDATLTPIIDVPVASGTGFGFRINIIGTQDATGDTVFESIFGAIRNQGGTTALVGSTITDRTDDAGATTWVITVSADDAGDNLAVEVTGEAAHTIDWKVNVEILDV